MYCGNCGAEIEEGAAFCPTCGLAVESGTNKKPTIDNKKVGKIIALGIAIVAVVIVATVGFRVYSYFESLPTEQQLQYAVNNYQNGGIVTTDGTWLYYNDSGLCRARLKDGSRQGVVSSDIIPEKMFYVGDSIFYYRFPGIYKTKVNKGDEIDLDFSVFSEDCFQADGKYYYVTGEGNYDSGGVYFAKVTNTDKMTEISDIYPTKLLMYKDYIYILSGFSTINGMPNENYGTWRIDKDGKNKISLMGFCPSYLVFSKDSIYFTDEDGTICSMALDGSQQVTYEGTHVNGGLNISDEYVFYLTYDSDSYNTTIHRMNKDGSGNIVLTEDDCSNLNIAGNWIFYTNKSYDYDIYKMSFDGELNEPIY